MNIAPVRTMVEPPRRDSWSERLRFYCQAADPSDPNLAFMASMWSYTIKHGHLHGRQLEHVERYWNEFMARLGV